MGGTGRAGKVRPQGQEREVSINNAARLKVAGGVAKGRRLESPDVFLRPMMAKVGGWSVAREGLREGSGVGWVSEFMWGGTRGRGKMFNVAENNVKS